MKLKITAIREAGDLSKERLVMKATAPTDVGEYVLLRTGTTDGKVTTGVLNTFWFPDKTINVGDYVVVYSKKGRDSEKEFKEVTSHFFYWGNSEALWNASDVAAVIMHAPDWESFRRE